MYYDKEGKTIDILQWVVLFEDRKYAIVDHTIIGTIRVSTCWIGTTLLPMTLEQTEENRPLIFETCLFSEGKSQVVCRYATEEQAKEGHLRAVDVILNLKEKEKELR